MKRLFTAFSILTILAGLLVHAVPTAAAETNLIANPGFETANGSVPASWSSNTWGTNTAQFTYEATGHTGSRSASVAITSYTSGDAKWYFTPVTATPGATYTFSNWYKSTAVSSLDAVVTTTSGTTSYIWIADLAPSASWKQQTVNFTAPANAKTITFFHLLQANGMLTVDDYSLVSNAPAPTPTPSPSPPPPTNTPPAVNMTAPSGGATVTGNSVTVSANASDDKGVAKVQFQLDGANLSAADTTAPYGISWDTTTVANGTHNLTAVATDTDGVFTTSAAVGVNVQNQATPPPPSSPPPSSPPAAGNLVPNPSVETANGSTPANWISNSWGTNTRNFTYETNGQDGSRSVKVTINSYTSGDAKWYFTPVTVTPGAAYTYSEWYKSNVPTEVDAMVTRQDGTVHYIWLGSVAANTGNWQKLNMQFTAPADAAAVTIFHLIGAVGYVQTDNFSLTANASTPPAQFNRALVTLNFDDGWRSIYTNGLPLLQKYGLTSTQYLNSTPIIGGYPDYMTYDMIKSFAAAGHELAWHTRNHVNITSLSPSQLNTELTIPADFLSNLGKTQADFKHFASPYGAYNASSVSAVMSKYQSHRSTDVGYNTKSNVDVTNIKVQNITNTTTPATVQAWVNQAIADKSWLVIVYHEVATNAADPTYSVTPANLDAELNIIKQSGVTVKTVDAALAEVKPQL